MLLEGTNSVIYGGGGAIGARLLAPMAREAVRIFLAGCAPAKRATRRLRRPAP